MPTVRQCSEKAHSSKTLTESETADTRDGGNAHSHPSTKPPFNVPMQWKDLKATLKQVFQHMSNTHTSLKLTKKVEKATRMLHNSLQQSETDARDWINEMSNHSKCTYRVTKTVKPSMKRIKCKFVMHCQHYAKLTQKQREKSALARVKKAKKGSLSLQLRNQKNDCPSNFILVVQIPTKTQTRPSELKPYLLTHCGVFEVHFTHNHPVYAAHTLSFRDV